MRFRAPGRRRAAATLTPIRRLLTGMQEEDWAKVLTVFNATRPRRGDKGRNDRR